MKYINFLFILLLHFSLVQTTTAQSAETDENGRTNAATAATPSEEEATTTTSDQDLFRKRGHDFDDPNAEVPEATEDITFPNDLEEMREEMNASGFLDNKKFNARLTALEKELNELRTYNELLRLENRSIRRSLGSCCSEVKDGMTAADAYLLQNAPNPFNASADIQFFIPNGIETAAVEIRDLKGVLIESFSINESGMGMITFDSKEAVVGTYLYTLVIEGEIIDSKVMMLTK